MTKFSIIILALIQTVFVWGQTCSTCTINLSSGTNVNLSLTSGKDVICISGIVTISSANGLGEGNDEICILSTGRLTWTLPPINTGSLTVKVQPGGIYTDNSTSYNGNVIINAGGQIRFNNGLTVQGNPANNISILSGGSMTVTGNLTLGQGNTINNNGGISISNTADIAEGTFIMGTSATLAVTNELYIHSDQFSSSGSITCGSLRFTNKTGDGPEFFPSSSTVVTGNIYIDATVILNGYLETTTGSVQFTSNGKDNGTGGMLKVSSTSTTINSTIDAGGYYQGTFWDADTNGGYKTTPGQPVTSAMNGFDVINIQSPAQNLNNIIVAISLPVEYISFYAKSDTEKIVLNWQTASETNNDRFEIFRSSDGISFDIIDQVSGNGSTSDLTDYQYTDFSPVTGTSYYRLKQVDLDGKAAWSKTISAKIEPKETEHRIIPNPVKDHFYISGLTEGEIIGVYDNKGVLLASIPAKGNNRIDFNSYSHGIYFIRLVNANKSFVLVKE